MPEGTVVRSGRRGAEGLELAEVHWPVKGKGKKPKVWHCVVVEASSDCEEEELMPTYLQLSDRTETLKVWDGLHTILLTGAGQQCRKTSTGP